MHTRGTATFPTTQNTVRTVYAPTVQQDMHSIMISKDDVRNDIPKHAAWWQNMLQAPYMMLPVQNYQRAYTTNNGIRVKSCM